MKRSIALAVLCVAVFGSVRLLWGQTHPTEPEQATFVILYEPGPKWIKGREIFDQDLHDHGQYMSRLLEQGHLQLGGPFTDSSGGMAIVTAKDKDEAMGIMKNDPGITEGVFKGTLRPWYVVFRKGEKPQ
jgi:uncharacterized protein YciI